MYSEQCQKDDVLNTNETKACLVQCAIWQCLLEQNRMLPKEFTHYIVHKTFSICTADAFMIWILLCPKYISSSSQLVKRPFLEP